MVFIRAPEEIILKPGAVLRVERPMNCIPESGLHLYMKYLSHNIERLGMVRSNTDPFVLIQMKNGRVPGLTILR